MVCDDESCLHEELDLFVEGELISVNSDETKVATRGPMRARRNSAAPRPVSTARQEHASAVRPRAARQQSLKSQRGVGSQGPRTGRNKRSARTSESWTSHFRSLRDPLRSLPGKTCRVPQLSTDERGASEVSARRSRATAEAIVLVPVFSSRPAHEVRPPGQPGVRSARLRGPGDRCGRVATTCARPSVHEPAHRPRRSWLQTLTPDRARIDPIVLGDVPPRRKLLLARGSLERRAPIVESTKGARCS